MYDFVNIKLFLKIFNEKLLSTAKPHYATTSGVDSNIFQANRTLVESTTQ